MVPMPISKKAKKATIWGLAGLLALFFVKQFLLDLRRVPSASMAPTLLPGDFVLVDKLYAHFAEPRRFDVVLFDRPDLGRPFLKRVVGLPGESLQLVDGDLFLNGRIESKSAEQFLSMAASVFDSASQSLASAWSFRSELARELPDRKILLEASTGLKEEAGLFRKFPYLVTTEGEKPGRLPAHAAHDAWLYSRFEAPERGTLRALLGEQADRFIFEIQFDPSATRLLVVRESIGPPETLLRAELPGLATSSVHDIECGNIDNRLFLRLDGKEAISPIPYDRNTPYSQREAQEARLAPSVVNLTFRGGKLILHRLRLLRDLDYVGPGIVGVDVPCTLGPGEFFLLGDHAEESEDSRSFGRVLRQEIQGKGLRVVFPFSRFGGI